MSEKNLRAATSIRRIAAIVFDVIVVVLGTLGCVSSWRRSGLGMFMFYTIDSNLLGVIACALHAAYMIRRNGDVPAWVEQLKYMAACCLTVTFVVVVLVLAPTSGPNGFKMMLLSGEMLYHHLLCPLLTLTSFVFLDGGPAISRTGTTLALLPTLTYAAITIVLNIARVIVGPYPFLRVYSQPVWMSAAWGIAILCGAYLIAWLLALGNRKLARI